METRTRNQARLRSHDENEMGKACNLEKWINILEIIDRRLRVNDKFM